MLQKSVAFNGLQRIMQDTSALQTLLEKCPEEINDPSVVDEIMEFFGDIARSANGIGNDIALLHHENRNITELNTW
ncbi:MAG: hypothetical protein OXM61_17365 [Candidatus Poribacteria bacterium]|nr:hypothetical protein [Candidatus Poribacteria bacterium]